MGKCHEGGRWLSACMHAAILAELGQALRVLLLELLAEDHALADNAPAHKR